MTYNKESNKKIFSLESVDLLYTNKIKDIVNMMRRALNTLDYRLIDHGERIAYIVMKLFEKDAQYDENQLVKICYLALFHDIGAYKTEDLDSLSDLESIYKFEIKYTLEHSVFGYLFLKEHEFFEEFADAVLYHHFYYQKLVESECINKDIAAAIFVADRLDIMIMKGLVTSVQDAEKYLKTKVFHQELVTRLFELEEQEQVLTKCINHTYLNELLSYMNAVKPSEERNRTLIHILPHAIDFRSEYTVTHTAATVKISILLAEYCRMDKDTYENIYLGALLHDVGKIAISKLILEKDSKLTEFEFKAMKDHVVLTDYILKDCVSDEILNIAARHHEKLDGTGYPKGLGAEQLSLAERIVAVADILSALMGKRSYKDPFPKEKVVSILKEQAVANKVCPYVVNVAIEHYQDLQEEVNYISDRAEANYAKFSSASDLLLEKLK